MKGQKRKTRSDKFPLTLHPTGQYCKKIKGKIHYFGMDKRRALEKYLEQAAYLHGGQNRQCYHVDVRAALEEGEDRGTPRHRLLHAASDRRNAGRQVGRSVCRPETPRPRQSGDGYPLRAGPLGANGQSH